MTKPTLVSRESIILERSIEVDRHQAERMLRARGATRFASFWWVDSRIVGVLEDGRVIDGSLQCPIDPESLAAISSDADHANTGQLGQAQVRDPDSPCSAFQPRTPGGPDQYLESKHYRCLGDGHYLCRECRDWSPDVRELSCVKCDFEFECRDNQSGRCPRCGTRFTWTYTRGPGHEELYTLSWEVES